jgi:hypothetical protein
MITPVRLLVSAGLLALVSCGVAQQPYHGFQDQNALDSKDSYVLHESYAGGALDPAKLAESGQNYNHHGISYSQSEEGYYQWGAKLYTLGYRDVYYIRDLAPRAMHHELTGTYDHAVQAGFEDAAAQNSGK